MNDDKRAYSGAIFALELDQDDEGGLFKSVEGGNIKADLIKYQNGMEKPVYLRSGKPKYEDIKVQVGMSMSKPFYQWIQSFCAGTDDRRTGAIVAADFTFQERARREFAEAIITEVGFPKLDGGDKNACFMSVTISPETVVYKPGSGKSKIANQKAKYTQKMWAASNFDFKIDGFAEACKQVTKVDAFTIKMKPIEYQHSGQDGQREMLKFQQLHAPLRRTVTIDEVGGSALYLLSDLSTGVTGEIHYVDSGYNIISTPRPEDLKNVAE